MCLVSQQASANTLWITGSNLFESMRFKAVLLSLFLTHNFVRCSSLRCDGVCSSFVYGISEVANVLLIYLQYTWETIDIFSSQEFYLFGCVMLKKTCCLKDMFAYGFDILGVWQLWIIKRAIFACIWSICKGKFANVTGLLIEFVMFEVFRELGSSSGFWQYYIIGFKYSKSSIVYDAYPKRQELILWAAIHNSFLLYLCVFRCNVLHSFC